jgi:3-oxoacyl-[acyl-carrier protein] reductase
MNDVVFDFTDRVYFVSGGSRGIGKAIVEALAKAGASCAVTYRSDDESVHSWALGLSCGGARVLPLRLDVRDPEAVRRAVAAAVSELGKLDGLVNNAGITRDEISIKMADSSWQDVIETNLNGSFFLAREVLKGLVRRGGGRIVNIASVSGITGLPGQANYCASKGGLIAMTRSLALEMARFNIQINALAPGFIDTEMLQALPENQRAGALQKVPARRFGSALEVAKAVLFLLSDAAAYMTGQTMVLDGGLTA